jgi:nitric oxide reductase subunit B
MNSTKQLWVTLIVLLVASFGVLLWSGRQIEIAMPPVPERVVSESGETIYTRDEIQRGRQVWQSIGGQQLGSIWGHGGLVAPDWSADWLHREIIVILDQWAEAEHGSSWAELGEEDQNALQGRLRARMRQNTYDPQTGTVTLTDYRAQAIRTVSSHYESLFGNDPATAELREGYAMRNNTIAEAEDRRLLGAFFWWTAWSAATERPNSNITYTNNWPSEPLIGNRPPASMFLWSAFSVTFLLAGIAALGWHYARTHAHDPEPHKLPTTDPLRSIVVTPSMIATAKYFWVVLALFLFQILLGALTAHYQVEGQLVYGYEMAEIFPYSITRTWHTQLAVLWIATAWLGTGLYMAPAISGKEPKFQRLGVNVLWVCLLIIVVGSFAGQWLAVMQKLGISQNFWWGHQGWEYADMGRFWQWFLFIGLMIWLVLVGRALWPALRTNDESRSIVACCSCPGGDRSVLRGGVDVGRAHASFHRRVLALVVGAPVGRRLLRSVRHRRDRAPVHPPGADQGHRHGRGAVRDHRVHEPAACWAPCTIFTSPARRPRWWRWAQASRAGSGAAGLHRLRSVRQWRLQAGARPPWMARYRWPIMFFIAVASGTWSGPACSAS